PCRAERAEVRRSPAREARRAKWVVAYRWSSNGVSQSRVVGNAAEDRKALQTPEAFDVLDRRVEEFRDERGPEPDEEAERDSHRQDGEGLREVGLLRQVCRVEGTESISLPTLLEAPGHLGLELLAEEGDIVLVELLVVAGQGGHLLLCPGGLLDPSP